MRENKQKYKSIRLSDLAYYKICKIQEKEPYIKKAGVLEKAIDAYLKKKRIEITQEELERFNG